MYRTLILHALVQTDYIYVLLGPPLHVDRACNTTTTKTHQHKKNTKNTSKKNTWKKVMLREAKIARRPTITSKWGLLQEPSHPILLKSTKPRMHEMNGISTYKFGVFLQMVKKMWMNMFQDTCEYVDVRILNLFTPSKICVTPEKWWFARSRLSFWGAVTFPGGELSNFRVYSRIIKKLVGPVCP